MPAAPEILERSGAIGLVEIAREAEAEQASKADRHVGIGGKIAVDLHGIAIGGERQFQAGMARRVGKHRIDQVHRDVVGDHRLLHRAPQDQDETGRRFLPPEARGVAQLRQQVAGPHDRPGHEMGKEAHQQGEIEQPRRARAAVVDIDHIAQALEREERDADRQDDRLRQRHARQIGQEPGILEPAEHAEVAQDRQPQPQQARSLAPGNDPRPQPVPQRTGHQQRHEPRIPQAIEQPGGEQQQDHAPITRAGHQAVERKDRQEEDVKGQRGKEHRGWLNAPVPGEGRGPPPAGLPPGRRRSGARLRA